MHKRGSQDVDVHETFRGWETFGGLIEHMKFVRNHYRKIDRIAIVTDDRILTTAPKIAEHFVHPEIKLYKKGEKASALAWLKERD